MGRRSKRSDRGRAEAGEAGRCRSQSHRATVKPPRHQEATTSRTSLRCHPRPEQRPRLAAAHPRRPASSKRRSRRTRTTDATRRSASHHHRTCTSTPWPTPPEAPPPHRSSTATSDTTTTLAGLPTVPAAAIRQHQPDLGRDTQVRRQSNLTPWSPASRRWRGEGGEGGTPAGHHDAGEGGGAEEGRLHAGGDAAAACATRPLAGDTTGGG